jgi:thiol-disulfide isomerase/thioredoxin
MAILQRLLIAFILLAFGMMGSAQADNRFIGLRHASPAEIKQVLPSSVQQVTVIDFSSVLCLDCQKMKPVLKKFQAMHPKVNFLAVDVNEGPRKYPQLMRTFKPLTVPALVFINSKAQIIDVLYNYHPLVELEKAYNNAAKL